MTREELIEKIESLKGAQLALQGIMAASDKYAAKCLKMGLNFSEAYPEEYSRYTAANAEYNENEGVISALEAQLAGMPEEPEAYGGLE